MIKLPGYTISKFITSTGRSKIFRGNRNSDNCPVIVKQLDSDYPSARELSSYAKEYNIMVKASCDGAIKPYDLVKHHNSLVIIMEDVEGEAVSNVLKKESLSISEKLCLAVAMTRSLSQVHHQRIVHKDINPTNFAWNRQTGQVKIIDFGFATEISKETFKSDDLNTLEGTLSYISPEQTGRLNRPIDFRSDLYSLGVCLYEIFTGRLPFVSSDPLELIYWHIVGTPEAPSELNPEIPQLLSDIIMKLLSKTPEERYQSAVGLLKDLEYCLNYIDSPWQVDSSYKLGAMDFAELFIIPQTLYGRDKELNILSDCLTRTAYGSSEFALIRGYSGIGKSSLIDELRKPIISKRAFFVSFTCELYQKNTPYFVIGAIFSELLQQLLSRPHGNLDFWKQRIIEALGDNGQVVIDILPNLKHLIGPQPPLPDLSPIESIARFNMVFASFISVFADHDHPLVLFLDDLHWIDISSLDLIRYLLTNGALKYTLFIGAYRENQLPPGLPLLSFLQEFQQFHSDSNFTVALIDLKPLDFDAVNLLIADTLHSNAYAAEPLSRIIYQKTKGNPFYTRRLLNSLYQQGAFTFIPEKGQWDYDLEMIESVQIADNVVEFLVDSLKLLPDDCVDLLMIGACAGNYFDLTLLSEVSGNTISAVGKNLLPAIEQEVIRPLSGNYSLFYTQISDSDLKSLHISFTFAHDRVQQAIDSLIPVSRKQEINLKLGREYQKKYQNAEGSDDVFTLVHYLNYAIPLITSKEDRTALMRLNRSAGEKAIKTGSFSVAFGYFDTALSLQTESEWQAQSAELFDLLLKQAEAALLTGAFDKASGICKRLDRLADTKIKKGYVSGIRLQLYILNSQTEEAIAETQNTLRLFDFSLLLDTEKLDLEVRDGIDRLLRYFDHATAEDLVHLPLITDEDKLMVMKLISQIIPSAYVASHTVYNYISLAMFEYTIEHGLSQYACRCFADCGVILATNYNEYEIGYNLGKAAFALIEKLGADSQKAPVYYRQAALSPWRAHYREAISYYDLTYRASIQTGDIIHMTVSAAYKAYMLLLTGTNLSECKARAEQTIALSTQMNCAIPLLLTELILHTISKLHTSSEQNAPPDAESDRDMANKVEATHNGTYLSKFYITMTIACYIIGEYDQADEWNKHAGVLISSSLGDYLLPDHYLFTGLLLIRQWKAALPEKRSAVYGTLLLILQKLKNWSDNCPENFSHKYLMLSAQMAIIDNAPLDTVVELFNRANASIGSDDFVFLRALCLEQYGEYWLDRGDDLIGRTYIRGAYYHYQQWGSNVKTEQLTNKYPQFFVSEFSPASPVKPVSQSVSVSIDLLSVLKSTQAISSEIHRENLFAVLIRIMIESAGAEKCSLLLRNDTDGQYYVEAVQNGKAGVYRDLSPVILSPVLFTESKDLCVEIVQQVIRTGEALIINNAAADSNWQHNPYVQNNQIKSVLCFPILYQNQAKGLVYLENNLYEDLFTADRLEALQIISSQAAISIENARLYASMEEQVRQRTLQLNAAYDKLKELSFRDMLTNLYNRRYLFEFALDRITQFMNEKAVLLSTPNKRASLNNNVIGVYMLDIDRFKDVNDTYGHASGDAVLTAISNILRRNVRSDDLLIRWGGEEFLIILMNTLPDYLDKFALRILAQIEESPLEISPNITIHKTCSLGYTEIPLCKNNPSLLNLEKIINISDYAMYKAKENGRNCAVRFSGIKPFGSDEGVLKYLSNLTKSSALDEEHFKLTVHRNGQA